MRAPFSRNQYGSSLDRWTREVVPIAAACCVINNHYSEVIPYRKVYKARSGVAGDLKRVKSTADSAIKKSTLNKVRR